MRRFLSAYAIALAAWCWLLIPASARADIVEDVAPTCTNSTGPGALTFSHGNGSDRVGYLIGAYENSGDPESSLTSLNGQTPSTTFPLEQKTGPNSDNWYIAYLFNETKMAAMSGDTITWSDTQSGTFTLYWCWGVIENVDQTSIPTDWLDSDETTSSDNLVSTTTSDSGDYIIQAAVASGGSSSTSFSGEFLTEIEDDDGGDSWRGYFGAGVGTGAGSEDDSTITHSASGDLSAVSVVFTQAASGPTISTALAQHASDDDQIDFDVTFDQNVDVYWAAYNHDQSAPADCDAVITATGALSSDDNSQTATASVEYSFTVSVIKPLNTIDVYVCGENASMEQTSVGSLTGQQRTARSGFAFISDTGADGLSTQSPLRPRSVTGSTQDASNVVTSVSAIDLLSEDEIVDMGSNFPTDGPCSIIAIDYVDDEFTLDPRCGTANATGSGVTFLGDVDYDGSNLFSATLGTDNWSFEYETDHSPNSCSGTPSCISVDEDGIFTIDYTTNGQRSTFDGAIQIFATATGVLSAPYDDDHNYIIFGQAPDFDSGALDQFDNFPLIEDAAMTSQDFGAACSNGSVTVEVLEHPDSDTHPGTSFSAGVLSGTPTTADTTGSTIAVWCRDADDGTLYDYEEVIQYVVPVAGVTMGNYVGDAVGFDSAGEFETNLVSDQGWRLSGDGTTLDNTVYAFQCSDSAALFEVISHDPASSESVTATEQITVTVSLGETTPGCLGLGGGRPGLGIGIGAF